MFSGIVRHLGLVAEVGTADGARILRVDPGDWSHGPAPGDSVSVSGCCLTVTEPRGDVGGRLLCFDVVPQTLRTTTLGGLKAGDPVNLEPAVTPASRLDGHIVLGHVDGVGVVSRAACDGPESRLRIEPPPALMGFIVDKGSIAVDGVSLTVAALGADWFEAALVPTTLRLTTLGRLRAGSRVNLETDYLVKAVVSWLERKGG